MRRDIVLVGSLFALGCRGDPDAPPREPTPSSVALTAAPTSAEHGSAATSAPAFDASKLPRAYRARGEEAVKANAGCVSCHPNEAAAWNTSHHRRAFENPAFQASFVIEPTDFCRGCHAPESSPASPTKQADALGVACVTCHIANDDMVLAAPRDGHVEKAPHPIERSVAFGGEGACAGCHEFPFPFAPGNDDAHFMQTTIREHARSPARDRSCASCHMPMREGKRSHGFEDVRDPAFLRAAIDITATRDAPNTIIVTLTQKNPGHAFPTGDLFRRIEVGALLRDAGGKIIAREVVHLARSWALFPGEQERRLTHDGRVMFDPREVGLTLPLDARSEGFPISWWVTYQRVLKTEDGKTDGEATIESEVPLASGTLSAVDRK